MKSSDASRVKSPAISSAIPLSRTAIALAAILLAGPASAEVPKVVTDVPVVHGLVALVMGDLGSPDILLDQGASAHSYQLRPSQARALQDADLVVWVGPELTPWLDRALTGAGAGVSTLRLLEAEGTRLQGFGGADGDHDGADPHAWLDPGNAGRWLGVIAAELARHDPANGAVYAANAGVAQARIAALDAALAARLAPLADRPFVVFHDAYGYLIAHYGLTLAGTLADGDAATPGAARIAGLRQIVEAGGAVCLFPDAGHDPRPIEALAEGTGARVGAALDPEGNALDRGPGLYEALLEKLAGTLADCLSGG